jgi:radical SAM superfamily enzyme with C-terminal helix-hairpin-helix motif
LNTVTEDQLMSTIPGFSGRMVREFMEYRPYISIQQFRKEIGKYVDADQVAMYEQYVFVPIDVDQADAATLQQLPGVDAAIADQLIAGRPYGSSQAFLAKLAGLVPAADAQQAAAYLAAA